MPGKKIVKVVKKKVVKKPVAKKPVDVKGYCFGEKKKRSFAKGYKVRHVKTNKGRNVGMICGKCASCGTKMCRIVS